MILTIAAIRNRCTSTVKSNERFKGGEIWHYDPELMIDHVLLNLFKEHIEGSMLIEVPADWREQFDIRYSAKRILAEQNRKAEQDRKKQINGHSK